MQGRIRKKLQQLQEQAGAKQSKLGTAELPICDLCHRPIPALHQDAHHWIPKSKGGRETSLLHRICHRQIHALYTESQLAQLLNTPALLLAEPEIDKFVRWVKLKPPDFFERTRKSQRKRN